jgi:hypothetical protein
MAGAEGLVRIVNKDLGFDEMLRTTYSGPSWTLIRAEAVQLKIKT